MIRGRGFGQAASVPVNVGPGTLVNMTPADAASYWATQQVTEASGGSAQNPFGSYYNTVLQAYKSSPTIQNMIPATPQNLRAPGYTPGSPQYETENTALGPGVTKVLTLDSYMQQVLAEMTSMGPQSSAAAGGQSNLAQQAQAYCAATGVDCSNIGDIVQKYGSWFNNWASQTLEPGVTESGITESWSGGPAQPGVVYLGASPSGAIPGETLNYGPAGQAGGVPGEYTPGGYVNPATGQLETVQTSPPGGYWGFGPSPPAMVSQSGGGPSAGNYAINMGPAPIVPSGGSSGGASTTIMTGPSGPCPAGYKLTSPGVCTLTPGAPGTAAGGGTSAASSSNPLTASVQFGGVSIPVAALLAAAAGALFLL